MTTPREPVERGDIPKPEHPRPQLVRDDWQNLNGTWQFEMDLGDSGVERGLVDRALSGTIVVPFAPESEASGIGHVDYMAAVWYRRQASIPAEWGEKRVLLHFGAVDHDAVVWVDGAEVARHRGGFTPFTADLGHGLAGRSISIVVQARDSRDAVQARGKQSTMFENSGCTYTRTTGIWQTVWLEAVPDVAILLPRITPMLASRSFDTVVPLNRNLPGSSVRVTIGDENGEIDVGEVRADLDLAPSVRLQLPADRTRLWSPEDPHLYDLAIELTDSDGAVLDRVVTYSGLRSVSIDGKRILINGRPVFQRLVLDQGYYPDTLMTAPDDAAMVRDIQLSLAAGFNGARLHQKVFEERFLYHADRMGYLVWGEFGDWANLPNPHPTHRASFITQWIEAVQRDYNHPSIIGWCPLNETQVVIDDRIQVLDDVTRGMFLATKLADPTRPALDASGYSHRVPESDVYDSHDYTQDPAEFARLMAPLDLDKPFTNADEPGDRPISIPYRGQPYFCSEFGGIWWDPDAPAARPQDDSVSWGYGLRPNTEGEFQERFAGLAGVLLDDPGMFGYCYTQLTDVFQEQNGIYRFDRSEKLDVGAIREAQMRTAAIERTDPVPNAPDLIAGAVRK